MSGNPYKLRCSLLGHSKDVRCVTSVSFPSGESIISGSRDKLAKIWLPDGLGFVCQQTLLGSEGFVSAVTVSTPLTSPSYGTIITGSQDGKIRVYNPDNANPIETLSGHTDTVCSLSTKSGLILSGSWDKTARIWLQDGSPVITLTGHAAAIWAVEVLSNSSNASEIISLTGSADKTVKMWRGNCSFQTFKGHTDCVRALAVCDSSRFLSAANDATIRLWITSGECLATYYGHTNYIYGLSMMPSGIEFVSCGEDRSVRIWKLDTPDECQQTVFLPAQSVWAVSVMTNGDIVTGSSDGIVRVFTNDGERVADEDVIKSYEQELAATTLSAQLELGGIKASDLPGPESLFEPGNKEGQTKMVNQGGVVSCFSWSSSEGQWNKVGDVVGAAGQAEASKTTYEGVEYDYVFSVDIAEGQPPLKLPFNLSEDPWMAAQTFIHKHELSQYYLDTVANFIITNSKRGSQNVTPAASTETYVDPFTGGSRYVPGSSAAAPSAMGGSDPFTGAGRYVPPGSNPPPSVNSFFPVREFLRFDQANIEAIKKKMMEFNTVVRQDLRLSDSDMEQFLQICDPNWQGIVIPQLDILLQWPSANLLPVLDVLRLASRNPRICKAIIEKPDSVELLISLVCSSITNCMMIFRMLAHLLAHFSVHRKVLDLTDMIFKSIASVMVNTDPAHLKNPQWKNVQIAASTIFLNYSALVIVAPQAAAMERKAELVSTISSVVGNLQDEEALFRTLSAIGTLMCDEESLALIQSIDLNRSIDHLQGVDGKVGECAKQIIARF